MTVNVKISEMTRYRKNSVRIEYDRTGQNHELAPYWPRLEDRPYYELERRYTDGLGLGLNAFRIDSEFSRILIYVRCIQ